MPFLFLSMNRLKYGDKVVSESGLKGFVQVGKVRDSHGLKGELFVVTNLTKAPEWVEEFKEFILEFKMPDDEGKHIVKTQSFTVKKTRAHKKGFIVKADEINDRNESDIYKGAAFYIKKDHLETQEGEKIYLKEVEGFEVFDKGNRVGKVSGFSSNNAQDLLLIGEIEIPFVPQFVSVIDWKNKKIEMDLPEGLVDQITEE
jgi:16S rRNA processing protein RimM